MKNDYKYIIWDLDGTLLNTADGCVKSVCTVISKFELPELTESELLSFVGPPVRAHLQKTYKLTDQVAESAMKFFRDIYDQKYLFCAENYEALPELLEQLIENDYILGVATYKRTDMAKRILDHFNLSKQFSFIYGSDFDGLMTKEQILSQSISDMKCTDGKVLYIGDSQSDAVAAHACGVDFAAVTYGFGFRSIEEALESNPITIFETVDQMKQFLVNKF